MYIMKIINVLIVYASFELVLYLIFCVFVGSPRISYSFFLFFEREFQPMTSALDDIALYH